MEIYVKGKYIPNNYVSAIRSASGETDAKVFIMSKHRWNNKFTISDIEWKLKVQYIKKQTYSKKKTLIKFVHRWLVSGNKNFGQKLMCPHCRWKESQSMDHYHFLTCSESVKRKQLRLQLFNNLLQHLDTPPTPITLLVHGLQSFYNSQLTNIHNLEHKAITYQQKIGWDNFSRGVICKKFTITMNNHYKQKQRTDIFAGIDRTKQVINFTLSSHINEWYHPCDSNFIPNKISFKNIFMSLEKRSLLITIEFFYSRAEILPAAQKIWFSSSIEGFKKYPVKRLK